MKTHYVLFSFDQLHGIIPRLDTCLQHLVHITPHCCSPLPGSCSAYTSRYWLLLPSWRRKLTCWYIPMKQRLENFFFFWSPTEVVRTLACSSYSLKRINKPPCLLCIPCQHIASALVNWDDHQPSAGQFASGLKEPNTFKFLQLLLQPLVKQKLIYINVFLSLASH